MTTKRATTSEAPARVEEACRIARAVAVDYGRALPFLVDEFESEGLVAAAEALSSWDPSSGVPFGAWARQIARWRLRDFLRRWFPGLRRQEQLMMSGLHLDDLPRRLLGVEDPDLEAVVDGREPIARASVSVLESLPPRARAAVGAWLSGSTLRQAGALVGVTESRVCQMVGEYRRRLRGRLEGDGLMTAARGALSVGCAPQ